MKKTAFLILSIFLLTSIIFAQDINKQYKDKKGKTQLVGVCSKSGLKEAPFKEWYDKNHTEYKIKTDVLDKIKGETNDLSFQIFMGTWCGDSKRNVPRFYKILEHLNISEKKIDLVNLSNLDSLYKTSPTNEHVGKGIFKVPTFIVYRNGEEIGRIVEKPISTLELDLFLIVKNFEPKNSFQIVTEIQKEFKKKIPETDEEINKFALQLKELRINDRVLNSYGYLLMRRNQTKEALAILKINTVLYKRVGNTFDSLGEALMKEGKNFEALKAYSKSLELDKHNENAIKMIAELVKKMDGEKKSVKK